MMNLLLERMLAARRFVVALLIVLALLPALAGQTEAQQSNGAGLIVQQGDGTLIYAYVQFDEEELDGVELLTRSGINATMAPYGGLGAGVCSINGEGCPADNCYCKSYTSPAYYWHYYILDGGSWVELPLGPSSRDVRDGDIDLWSWNAGTLDLPIATIEEIAAMNGVQRGQSDMPATPQPSATPPSAAATTTAPPTSVAVIVTPGATPQPLPPDDDGGDTRNYLVFGALLAGVVVAGGALALRNRRNGAP